MVVYSQQSVQQLLLLKICSEKLSFLILFLKLAKVVDFRRFLFSFDRSFDHKKGLMYVTECFPQRVEQKGRKHTIKTKSSI